MRISIKGRPASKKNSKRIFRNRYSGKVVALPSEAYETFKQYALLQLAPIKYSREFIPFSQAINVTYIFYQKGKMTQDFDNAIGSINDILEDAGIIVNDKLIKQGSFIVFNGEKDWMTSINIEYVGKE